MRIIINAIRIFAVITTFNNTGPLTSGLFVK